MDTKYQNLPKEHICENCNTEMDAPMHCGHGMHVENLEDGPNWVCWMGTSCGKKLIDSCCDNSSLVYKN
jgi:hypothetical protein